MKKKPQFCGFLGRLNFASSHTFSSWNIFFSLRGAAYRRGWWSQPEVGWMEEMAYSLKSPDDVHAWREEPPAAASELSRACIHSRQSPLGPCLLSVLSFQFASESPPQIPGATSAGDVSRASTAAAAEAAGRYKISI